LDADERARLQAELTALRADLDAYAAKYLRQGSKSEHP
jgi:hypothetical protein